MPIIYTYPTVIPASNDLILLTDESDSEKATKTATVSSLLSVGLAQDINTTKVTLSNAQLLDLDATPIELVGAPGAGKALQVLAVYGFLDYTAPQFNAVELRIRSAGSSSYLGEFDTPFTNSSVDKRETWKVLSPGSWIDNTKLEIYATGAMGAGGSTLTIYTTYKIIDV
tara:strand:- start:38 stop:547 length:510 start_codon:yes stop_codon:yes gene_type:complete